MNTVISPWMGKKLRGVGAVEPSAGRSLRSLVDDYERQLILIGLAAVRGNQRHAARLLGVLPSTLNEKMRRLGIRTVDLRVPPGGGAAPEAGPPEQGRGSGPSAPF